ncbi:hypothetical protein KQI65_00960 [bacterium]|nr:hypothetical protein [bacterium]
MRSVLPIVLLCLLAQGLQAQEYVFTPYGPERGVPRDIVTDMLQDYRGFVWVALAHAGVRRLDGSNAVALRSAQQPLSREAFALATDQVHHVFVGGNAGVVAVRLHEDAHDSVEHVLSAKLRKIDGPVRRLEMRTPQILYIENASGAYELDLRDSTLTEAELRPPPHGVLSGTLPEFTVRDAARDCLKREWVATDRGLLLRDDSQQWLFDAANGLPAQDVYSVMIDREANVWCGTSEGLYMHVPGRVVNYSIGNSLPADFGAVHCVLESHDRSVWMGGDGGLLRFFGGPTLRLSEVDGLPSAPVRAMLELPTGELLVGTDDGLVVWTGSTFTAAPDALTLPDRRVTAMLQAEDRSYWIATRGGLLHWDGTRQQVFTRADGLPSADIHALAEDAYDLLWVGTSKGLVRLSSDNTMSPVMDNELSDMPVLSLYADNKDRIWIGTGGAGVYVHSRNGSVQITREGGLAGMNVGFITADNHGTLYFGTGAGVSVLPEANIRYLMPVDSADRYRSTDLFAHLPYLKRTAMHVLDRSTGLLTAEYVRGSVMRDGIGRLWFSNSRGVSSYNPPRPTGRGYWQPPLCRPVLEKDDVPRYRIHIADLCINDTCTTMRYNITIGPDDHVLRLRLLLPTFRNPGKLRYFYQLWGMEYSWHESSTGEILYTGLPPGSYTLVVQAALGEGAWTDRYRMMDIEVTPPFTDTFWFWLLLIALAFFLGYIAQRQRHAWLLARERRRRRGGGMTYNPN